MTALGRWCAVSAATLAVVTAATWSQSGGNAAMTNSRLDGSQLFRAKGCASCHAGPDSTTFVSGFPPLTDASGWAGQRRPGMSAEEYLAQSLLDPGAFISPLSTGGQPMPQLDLTEDEVDALVDYLLGR